MNICAEKGEYDLREIDERAVQAGSSQTVLDCFVIEQELFILRCASRFVNRYVTKSDDEWSIALAAFFEAVKSYAYTNGSFLSFAELVIKRRLTDELRKQSKYKQEIPTDPYDFSGEPGENEERKFGRAEILEKLAVEPEHTLKEEIEAVTMLLKQYGFSFYDLVSCSPKAGKTKAACARAVTYVAEKPVLCNEMRANKTLPLKIIEENTKVPRKILERHRKYIIAAIEIITGDYPCLAEYMRSFREESNL